MWGRLQGIVTLCPPPPVCCPRGLIPLPAAMLRGSTASSPPPETAGVGADLRMEHNAGVPGRGMRAPHKSTALGGKGGEPGRAPPLNFSRVAPR